MKITWKPWAAARRFTIGLSYPAAGKEVFLSPSSPAGADTGSMRGLPRTRTSGSHTASRPCALSTLRPSMKRAGSKSSVIKGSVELLPSPPHTSLSTLPKEPCTVLRLP
eukprot:scaffold4331_cov400-Prasinococcus_capsulatus_cf.AAC.7